LEFLTNHGGIGMPAPRRESHHAQRAFVHHRAVPAEEQLGVLSDDFAPDHQPLPMAGLIDGRFAKTPPEFPHPHTTLSKFRPRHIALPTQS
jgi:hypothetical protein